MVIVPAALAAVFAGGVAFRLSVLIVAILMTVEWGALIARPGRRQMARLLVTVSVGGLLGLCFVTGADTAILAAVPVCMAAAAAAAGLRVASPAWTAVAVLSTGVAGIALIWLRELPDGGLALVVWTLATVALTDVGAYLVGRALGGPKLWPSVSPAKTWAGVLGGLFAAAAVAVVASQLVAGAQLGAVLAAALVVSLVGQGGDLLESALKRRFKVKDTGGLIPGHGGVLDRVDGQVAAIPVVALAVLVSGSSVLSW